MCAVGGGGGGEEEEICYSLNNIILYSSRVASKSHNIFALAYDYPRRGFLFLLLIIADNFHVL